MDCPWLYALSTSDGWFLFFILWLKGGLMFTAFNTVSSTSQAFINVSLPCSGGILFYLALQHSEPLECEKSHHSKYALLSRFLPPSPKLFLFLETVTPRMSLTITSPQFFALLCLVYKKLMEEGILVANRILPASQFNL